MNTKPTRIDIGIAFVILIFFLSGFWASFQQSNWVGLIVTGAFSLYLIWFVTSSLRTGTRPLTKLEAFEGRSILWAVVTVVGGLLLLLALWQYWLWPLTANAPQLIKIAVVLVPLALWAAATLYTLSRLRDRSEPVEAYKRRVGFKDDES